MQLFVLHVYTFKDFGYFSIFFLLEINMQLLVLHVYTFEYFGYCSRFFLLLQMDMQSFV